MKETWLFAEFENAVRRIEQCHLERLACVGCRGIDISRAGGVGVSNIEANGDGTYQRVDHGTPAVILPARENDQIIDLVAFRTSEPGRFWIRVGLAGVLGYDFATMCVDLERPLSVHLTPLSWLRAGGEGLCVLNSNAWEARRLLRDAVELTCETEDLARACRDLTRQREPRDYPAINYIAQGDDDGTT